MGTKPEAFSSPSAGNVFDADCDPGSDYPVRTAMFGSFSLGADEAGMSTQDHTDISITSITIYPNTTNKLLRAHLHSTREY